ncbi:hypothetical protein JRC04_05045 [Mycolicibacterium sp. S2-37]|nr:hypothetical protein [Mycolicibacterium sp. S2-37]MBO0676824.1 hypothetical protein [Mycolicibacterium sp. S2-37]
MAKVQIELDTEWSEFHCVQQYADDEGIDLNTAALRLIDMGLGCVEADS